MAELAPLKGTEAIKDQSTPFRVPYFVRTSALRACAGALLLAAVIAITAAITTDVLQERLECALCGSICTVAFYHYLKMIDVRETLKSGLDAEMAIEAIRLSDWFVTLPPLVLELHLMLNGYTKWFNPPISAMMLSGVVSLGAFVRLGADELAPSKASTDWDTIVRLVGFICFIAAFGLLAVVLCNAFVDLPVDPQGGWAYAFSIPWLAYGIVAALGIFWRNVYPGYSEGMSIFKDVAYGTLDGFCKAIFTLYVASKALENNNLFFGFGAG